MKDKVMVVWEDSCAPRDADGKRMGWFDKSNDLVELCPIRVASFGKLLLADKRRVVIALSEAETQWGEVICIPRRAVRKIVKY